MLIISTAASEMTRDAWLIFVVTLAAALTDGKVVDTHVNSQASRPGAHSRSDPACELGMRNNLNRISGLLSGVSNHSDPSRVSEACTHSLPCAARAKRRSSFIAATSLQPGETVQMPVCKPTFYCRELQM